jgi:hypothetical protein
MNSNSAGDKLGERLATEARAARPAFNAELHARLMAELPSVTIQPRRVIYAPFSMLRAAALVALMMGTGSAALTLSKNSPTSQEFTAAIPVQEAAVAADEQAAENSRRLLALARVKPMKMLSRMLAAPSETPAAETEEPAPETIETPNTGVAAADGFSIRLISRAPFLDMQFNSQRAGEPRN